MGSGIIGPPYGLVGIDCVVVKGWFHERRLALWFDYFGLNRLNALIQFVGIKTLVH